MTRIDLIAWQTQLNTTLETNKLDAILKNIQWTSVLADEWQKFYDTARRLVVLYRGDRIETYQQSNIPNYQDIHLESCFNQTKI